MGVEPSAQTVFTHCSTSGAEREVSTPAAPVCEECECVNRPQCIARNGRGVGAPLYTDRSSCSRQTKVQPIVNLIVYPTVRGISS